MKLVVVDIFTGKAIFGMEGENLPQLNTGDVFVTPEARKLRVLQKAVIVHKTASTEPIVDLSNDLFEESIEVQLACCDVGLEDEAMTRGHHGAAN